MHYIRHYIHSGSTDPDFKDFLEGEFGIPCSKRTAVVCDNLYSYTFDVPENHPRFAELEPYLPEPTPFVQGQKTKVTDEFVFLTYYQVYSDLELMEAMWLDVRSSFNKVVPENIDQVCSSTCFSFRTKRGNMMRHTNLLGNYIVKSPVKWGNRSFASAEYISESDIFCSSTARKIMENAGLIGIEYESVRKKSTNAELEDVFRLKPENVIQNGGIVPVADMDSYVCDQCGMHMVGYRNTRGIYGIRADYVDNNIDFYSTLPLFTPDATEKNVYGGSSRMIVSHRFYKLVKELRMDRALHFIPINLV